MAKYRDALPQLDGELFITDGGVELVLIFQEGVELPYGEAFVLFKEEAGREMLRRYFRPYGAIARAHGAGLLLETVTWRANPSWGERVGYSIAELEAFNRQAVALNRELREEMEPDVKVVISGCIGPRGDGYIVGETMTAAEAADYHDMQARVFGASDADMIGAITMTYAEEATGIALAARKHGLPVAISFTVETDGRLPSGQALGDAIAQVDDATGGYPAYYMINCAHPTHFADALATDAWWLERIGGIRPNASRMSHAELDQAQELDEGDPEELGRLCAELYARLPNLNVMGGCCGTDHRHIGEICKACAAAAR
jgi:S-methylmethionine-dependent homocysteine/selenocysteine methylase